VIVFIQINSKIYQFNLRAVVAKNRAGQFQSNSESPTQTEYGGKFLDQSDYWKYFYRTRKVDGAF